MLLKGTPPVVLVTLIGSALAAQAPATAYIVTRLGVDTVAIERYTRSRDKLEGDVVLRYPRVGRMHYVADLGKRGEIKKWALTGRAVAAPDAPPFLYYTSAFDDSVAVISVSRNGKADTVASGRRIFHGAVAPAFPSIPTSYGIYEQVISSAKLGPDSARFVTLGVGPGGGNSAVTLRRRGRDSVAITSAFFPGWTEVARVDAQGRILAVNSTATTVKTVAERVPNLDFDAIAARWASAAPTGRPVQMSPPDTARATIGAANVEIAYSRPAKRGRVIFGNVVPWNEVWRTGANAATQLTTSADLAFGDKVVPAGKYTLWTLPTPHGAKLIINSETGQWGTDYHSDKDFARLDLNATHLSQPVEQFVIGIVPQGSGGSLRFAWDDTEYTIPFTVK